MISFIYGIFIPLQAIRLIWSHKVLRKYSVIPILINMVVFTAGGIIGWYYFTDWLSALLPDQNGYWYWQIVYYVLLLVFAFILIVFIILAFTIIGSFIASPFNDVLSEKTYRILTGGGQENAVSWKSLIGDVGRALGQEIKKILLFGMLISSLFILNLLPGLGPLLYGILSSLCSFLILAMEFVDFSMSYRRLSFRQKLLFSIRNIVPMIGFGISLFFICLIPFLNYLLLPVAVTGGTILYCNYESEKEKPRC